MSLIVQKFGGTSVADSDKIKAAARKAIRTHKQGNQVVMVVSAMGKNTDMLVDLARAVSDDPPAREMDMLLSTGEQVSVALMAMAISAMGHPAISLTGAQIGIKTDSTHTKARIRSISTEGMRRFLDEGRIVIAAGFQGIDEQHNITTLGRGGSDTTAVALAAVLDADLCEIHTDVDGIYTTDPRLLPEARRASQISYDEMLELASLGAGVMHNRSIEFAKKFGVPIHVRSSFSDQPGTLIVDAPESQHRAVCGAAVVQNESRVTLRDVPDRPGTSLVVFSRIAQRSIPVDMIVQNVGAEGKADISFTVLTEDLSATLDAVGDAADELRAAGVDHDDQVAKVSVVGLGMARQTGVARLMFRALAKAKVNILMITTSEIKISVLVARRDARTALEAVHRAFDLAVEPEGSAVASGAASNRSREPLDVVNRLKGMEDLTISDITLDDSQSLITLSDVPDTPGVADGVFQHIAEGGIFVDMIVQSFGSAQRANLSFTTARNDCQAAVALARDVSKRLGCGPISSVPHAAKLSVSGIGMRTHTGVATRMFRGLTEHGINVELISTSEVRVNVIISGRQGQDGVACLEEAFSDVLR